MSAQPTHAVVALLPAYGPHAAAMASAGILKLAAAATLRVEASTLVFVDQAQRAVGRLDDAFGLRPGAELSGPCCLVLREERTRPSAAQSMRWTLNELSTTAPAVDHEVDAGPPSLWCVPFQVPTADDHQLFVQFVQRGPDALALPQAVRSAGLWVDGVRHPSRVGWHWDGPSTVPAGGFVRRRFAFGDFEGAPRSGSHVIALEIFGQLTRAQPVEISGEPLGIEEGV